MDLKELIHRYLAEGRVMQLATVDDKGQPWLVHVWYAFSEDLAILVFTSNEAREHSAHIRTNGRVAGGVLSIELEALGQKVRGLCFSGRGTESAEERAREAYELYAKRWPQVVRMFSADDMKLKTTPMRMYVVTVERYVLFDEVNFPSQPRQEYVVAKER